MNAQNQPIDLFEAGEEYFIDEPAYGYQPDQAFNASYELNGKTFGVVIQGFENEDMPASDNFCYRVTYENGEEKIIDYQPGLGFVEVGAGQTDHARRLGECIENHFAEDPGLLQNFSKPDPRFTVPTGPVPSVELPNKVTFPCFVEGKKLQATVTHDDEQFSGRSYRLCFSDGHEGTFVPTNSGVWQEAGTGTTAYSRAVSKDMNSIRFFNHRTPPVCIPIEEGEKPFNVWVHSEGSTHDVFYGDEFRFSLYKTNEGWGVFTQEEENAGVDEEILRLVKRHLDAATA